MSLGADGLALTLRCLPGVTVGLLDADLRLVDSAGNWLRRTGMASSDLVGKGLADIAGAELATRCTPAIHAAFAGSTTQLRLRNPIRALDPSAPAWIEITVAPAPSESDEPRAFWLLRDVTDEQDLGDALTAAEQRLDLIGDGAREYAMLALDPDGTVTVWSAAAQRLLGHEAGQIVGRHLSRLFPAESAERGLVHGLLRHTAEKGSHRDEAWLVDVDGRRLRCQVSIRTLRDRESDHVGFACIVRDLTEQYRAQATMALREQMYRAAFDDAPSGMALVEHHAGGWWRVIEANAALASLVGHPVSALVEGGVPLLGDHGDGVVRDVFAAAASSPGGRFEVALQRADGTRRNVVVGLSPLGVTGGDGDDARRYVAQLHDVTARREAERATADALASERRAGAELRELQRQRTDFLATVSHELRTPLSSVLGYVELLTDGDLGELTASQHAALGSIARNSTRLRDLVGDLLLMSSIEQGSLGVSRSQVQLTGVLAAALDRVRPDALTRGIELTATGEDRVLIAIEATLLDKVLLALLTNALKFTGRGGHVAVRVTATPGEVEIAVVDDGIGIAPEALPHVFDPFFRAAVSERLAASGTGLGLSLVRKVVEIHGGEVSARSEPSTGSSFVVRLPASLAPDAGGS